MTLESIGRSATFSDGVKSFVSSPSGEITPGASSITQDGKYLKVNDDVFIPEIWRTNGDHGVFQKRLYGQNLRISRKLE